LVECYSQQKEYALAVKTIDGLLKAEDPRDPVLIVKKARLLERWYKHWDSQEIFQKILDPSVDQLFRKKVSEFVSLQDPLVAPLFKRPIEPRGVGSINPLLERAEERLKSHPLTSILNEKFNAVIQGLKAEALIQKKVFLEKEGKDYLWRGRGEQARIFLEELKRIDSDHEEVHQDLGKSYRLPN
jgi:tetratricopeptide (TPR) repeat protein